MKRLFITLLLPLMALTAFATPPADTTTLVHENDRLPELNVRLTDGRTLGPADLRGKVVLLNFWATWCPPCRAEMKRIPQEIVARFGAKADFVFLPVSRGETRNAVEEFARRNGYTFPMGLDPDASLYRLFATQGIPRNFVFDRDGRCVLVETGYTPEGFERLTDTLARLLGE